MQWGRGRGVEKMPRVCVYVLSWRAGDAATGTPIPWCNVISCLCFRHARRCTYAEQRASLRCVCSVSTCHTIGAREARAGHRMITLSYGILFVETLIGVRTDQAESANPPPLLFTFREKTRFQMRSSDTE